MNIIERFQAWKANRKLKKENKKDLIESRKLYLKELENNIDSSKKEIEDLIKQKAELEEIKKLGVESSKFAIKKGRIGKQRIEIEVIDGERTGFYPANIVDGYWIEWKEGKETLKKIIGTKPRTFEYKTFIFWRRGLKYYIKRNAEVTHEPDASAFVLPQAKFAMRIVAAVIKAETFVQIAKSTAGKDKKELIIFLAAIVIMGIAGIAGTGGYFK